MTNNISKQHKKIVDILDKLGFFFLNSHENNPIPQNPKRILVIFMLGLGDCVICSGAFKQLRALHKESQLDIVTDKRAEEFIRDCGYFDNIYIRNDLRFSIKKHGILSLFSYLYNFIKLRKIKYDIAINFYGNFFSNMASYITKASCRISHSDAGGGFFLTNPVSSENNIRQIDVVYDISKLLGLDDKSKIPVIPFNQKFNTAKEIGNNYAIIVPGALHRSKQWPPKYYISVAQWIYKELGYKIVILGTRKERDICNKIEKESKVPTLNLVGKEPLKNVFSIIKECDLYIGNDSGLMHVAAAFNRPLVQIFGPSVPARFGYYGKNREVCISDIKCKYYPCSPYKCKNNKYCIDKVDIQQVKSAIAKVLI